MYKLIREGRMGPSKVWKTGAVVSTYPKPMLVLEGDTGGLDIITKPHTINWVQQNEIPALLTKQPNELPPITAWNFGGVTTPLLTDEYSVTADSGAFPAFNNVGNLLLGAQKLPFKTVVVDPITRLSDIIYGHIAATNSGMLSDARRWAASIGLKVQQSMAELCKLPCHVVFIMHVSTEKNELTGEVSTEPMIYSKFRELVGGLLSQFFYAGVDPGEPPKPYVLTQPQFYVKGIGMRWPLGLPAKVGATFTDIYNTAVQSGEIEAP